jgi:hypothetical protein
MIRERQATICSDDGIIDRKAALINVKMIDKKQEKSDVTV